MTAEQVRQIIHHKRFPHETKVVHLIETHISWVLLADSDVYKIKKPLKLGFLDFSTLERRQEACEAEVSLNRRLAPEMYLGVLPITREGENYQIGGSPREAVDYAVHMRRMDETRQMDILLEQDQVDPGQLRELALLLAHFHRHARRVPGGESAAELGSAFGDIAGVIPVVASILGSRAAALLREVNQWMPGFLESVKERIEQRNALGYVIDGHGDLHCRNIFLTDPPVVFDCIEFNPDFRSLDMLNEIAFLCMDLERLGRPHYADLFLRRYLQENPVMQNPADQRLFCFFKLYRANVRIKVHCIHQREGTGPEAELREERTLIRQYFECYEGYYRELSG